MIESEIKTNAYQLIEKHGEKAVEIICEKIESFNNNHCTERDFLYLVLNEIEKIIKDKV